MPRKSGFKYQIDRRRGISKPSQEDINQEDEAYIFEDDENNEETSSKDGGDDGGDSEEFVVDEDEEEEESDEEELDRLAAPSSPSPNHPKRRRSSPRPKTKKTKVSPPKRQKRKQQAKSSDEESSFDEAQLESEDADENENDFDEEGGDTYRPARKKKAPTAAKRRGRPPKKVQSDDEEEEHQEESENDERPAKKKAPAKRRGRPPKKAPSDDDDEGEESENDNLPKKKKATAKLRGRPSKKAPSDDDDDDEEEYQEESENDDLPKKKKATAKLRGRPSKKAQSDDDNDDEEEYQEESENDDLPKKKEATAKLRGRPSRKAQSDDDEEEEYQEESENDEEEEDDDDDEDFRPSRGNSTRQRKSPAKKRGKVQVDDEDEEEYVDEDEDEDEDENDDGGDSDDDYRPTSRLGRPQKSARKPLPRKRARPRKQQKYEPDSDEEEDDYMEEKKRPAPSKSRRGRPREVIQEDSGDSSNDDERPVSRTSRPSRFSAAQASKRLTEMSQTLAKSSDEDEQENQADKDDVPMRTASPMTRKKDVMSSDEEFLDDSASEPSAEEAAFDSESGEEGSEVDEKPKAVDIDEEQVGTADEESSDEDEDDTGEPKGEMTPVKAKNGTRKEILPSPKQGTYMESSSGSDDDSEDLSKAFISAQKLPQCPSIEDAITAEPLPRKHVCYISPDGQSRQCFALETLRTIALKSNILNIRNDLDGERLNFLQPPHFRTAMSDDLLDQIASRFGRQALDLDGVFYHRKSLDPLESDDDDDDVFVPSGTGMYDDENFLGRVQRYMDGQMGSRDIYTCPLCYSEMHRRIVKTDQSKSNNDDDDSETSEQNDENLPSESVYDPLLVLGYLDNDKFEAASLFCFTKVANVKKHLQSDHRLDTRGIQGNDLYIRFRVRAPDGLLQRYLRNSSKSFGTFQGDMRRYWNEGNNQSFVYLLHLTNRAQFYLQLLLAEDIGDDDRVEAEDYVSKARELFESFQDRAEQEWERIAAPFRNSKDDLKGFLAAEGDDEEEEDVTPHFLAHRQIMNDESDSDENDLVHKLERKYAQPSNEGLLEEDDDRAEVYSEASDINGYYSEVEEEKDDWVKGIKSKRKVMLPGGRNGSLGSADDSTPVGKNLTKRKTSSAVSLSAGSNEPTPVSAKKRTVIAESDDDE